MCQKLRYYGEGHPSATSNRLTKLLHAQDILILVCFILHFIFIFDLCLLVDESRIQSCISTPCEQLLAALQWLWQTTIAHTLAWTLPECYPGGSSLLT